MSTRPRARGGAARASVHPDDGRGRLGSVVPTRTASFVTAAASSDVGTLDGACVTPFAITPLGDTMVLLGQGRSARTWGGFGGHGEHGKDADVFAVAAREFVEETMGCVRIFDRVMVPFKDARPVESELRKLRFVLAIVLQYAVRGATHTYVNFFVQVPWDTACVERFRRQRERAARRGAARARLEMHRIAWWGMDRLMAAVFRRRGIVEDAHGGLHLLRQSFQTSLCVGMRHLMPLLARARAAGLHPSEAATAVRRGGRLQALGGRA